MRGAAPTALVVDASAVVAVLADPGDDGAWAGGTIAGHRLAAPELMVFEAANVLRRLESSQGWSDTAAALAHQDLLDLPVALWAYAPLAGRAWELRANLTVYDASYVALAELLDAPLVTLDERMARAPGVGCDVWAPRST